MNLPIADSCTACNLGFSASEQYVACLLECVKHGTTQPNESFRAKVAATLKARPAIAQRIEAAKSIADNGAIVWQPEGDRVREVILKLARGHLAYELGLQRMDDPVVFQVTPWVVMSEQERKSFFNIIPSPIYPEIGSRSFKNSLLGKPTAYECWHVVQESTYQYAVGQGDGDWVQIFLQDYLACRVVWD